MGKKQRPRMRFPLSRPGGRVYKGIAMEGMVARCYTKNQQKSMGQYMKWARLAAGQVPDGGSVLEVITHYPEGARITRLSYGVGVPVDRLKGMVEKLCEHGLARMSADGRDVSYGITPRGLQFLGTWFKMKGFFEEFGESGRDA